MDLNYCAAGETAPADCSGVGGWVASYPHSSASPSAPFARPTPQELAAARQVRMNSLCLLFVWLSLVGGVRSHCVCLSSISRKFISNNSFFPSSPRASAPGKAHLHSCASPIAVEQGSRYGKHLLFFLFSLIEMPTYSLFSLFICAADCPPPSQPACRPAALRGVAARLVLAHGMYCGVACVFCGVSPF